MTHMQFFLVDWQMVPLRPQRLVSTAFGVASADLKFLEVSLEGWGGFDSSIDSSGILD